MFADLRHLQPDFGPIQLFPDLLVLLLVLSVVLFSGAVAIHRLARKRLQLPPGPPTLPILGNIHQTPPGNPWKQYEAWHKQYGPIISLQYGQRTMIMLGSYKMCNDLLNKRAENFSSRPEFVFGNEMLNRGMNAPFAPTGPLWKAVHGLHMGLMNPLESRKFHGLIDLESKQLLQELLKGEDFTMPFRRYALSLTYTGAYGRRLRSTKSPEVSEIMGHAEQLSKSVAGVHGLLIEVYPFLKHLPRFLSPWKRMGDRYFEHASAYFKTRMEEALRTKVWNWTKAVRQVPAAQGLSELELSFAVGVLVEASVATSPALLQLFVMAMAMHPSIQAVAQREMDYTVGPDRLPTPDDAAKLPYLNAIFQELLRWRPLTPIGVPHAGLRDDEYMGYRIPKDIPVIANDWVINTDPTIFEDPMEFKPERWLQRPNLPSSAFGFGKRMCPGQHLGRQSVVTALARLVWSFDISYAYEKRKRIEINPFDMMLGLVALPTSFKASIKVRSPQRKVVIEREWAAVEKDENFYLAQIGGC